MMSIMNTETIALVIAIISSAAVVGLMILLLVAGRRQAKSEPGAPEPDLARRLDDLHTAIANREGALGAQVAQLDSKLAILQESVTGREASLDEQVRGIGTQMKGITALFTNDRARGGWAEIGMKRIFEHGGLVEGRDYTCQVTHGDVRLDAVVHLPGGRNIVIDAKFPTARYVEALAEDDAERRARLLVEQGKELERIGKGLAAKGYLDLASGGYVVMYLPSQAVYETAAAAHPDLIDRLMASRVIVAGPSALYALLLNVGALLTEFRALQQADQILDDARELRRRMGGFADHLQRVGVGLAGAVRAFNGAVGSWESRLAPQLNRMSEQSGGVEVDGPAPVEEAVREMQEAGLRVAG
jgi:DNA recombination protein RmuC